MRLLAVVRLIRDTDETTSPERQLARIKSYAEQDGHKIIGVAEDLDVSGAVSPFDRPSFGPWLARPDEWDGLIVSRLDRLTRSTLDFLILYRWLDERGKVLIAIDAKIDMSTPQGRAFAQVGVVFAELERETIRARVLDAYRVKQQAGAYPGGTVPFGYLVTRDDGGKGWRFEHDPEYAPVVAGMAGRLLGGESLSQVSRWLNDSGIPTSRNVQRIRASKLVRESRWTPFTVAKVLRNPAVAGLVPSKGKPLRDPDGMVIQRCAGIITGETWDRVRAVLSDNADKTGPRVNSAPLRRVAFCGECGSALHYQPVTTKGKRYCYYKCSARTCRARMVRAEALEAAIEDAVLGAVGAEPMLEKLVHPAEDHAAELAQVEEALTALEIEYAALRVSAERFTSTAARLEARRDALAALPSRPERVEWRPTGRTFGEHWAGLADRGSFLRGAGVKAMVHDGYDAAPHRWADLRATLEAAGVTVEEPDTAAASELDGQYVVLAELPGGRLVSIYLGDLAELRDMAAQA